MATAKASKTATRAQATNAPCDAPVVKVIGQGTLLGSGMPFLLVTSGSELGKTYTCTYRYEGVFVGSRMNCSCMAGQFGRTCKHALVAREWLAETTPKLERDVADVAAPIVAQLSEIAETVRDMGSRETPSAKMAAYRQSSHPGDTALLRRDNRPFAERFGR